jgi:hypothetical protein
MISVMPFLAAINRGVSGFSNLEDAGSPDDISDSARLYIAL